jgi:hypothetical protein
LGFESLANILFSEGKRRGQIWQFDVSEKETACFSKVSMVAINEELNM